MTCSAGDLFSSNPDPSTDPSLSRMSSTVEANFDFGVSQVGGENGDDVLSGLIDGKNASVGPRVNLKPSRSQHLDDFAICEAVARGADEGCLVRAECSEHLAGDRRHG